MKKSHTQSKIPTKPSGKLRDMDSTARGETKEDKLRQNLTDRAISWEEKLKGCGGFWWGGRREEQNEDTQKRWGRSLMWFRVDLEEEACGGDKQCEDKKIALTLSFSTSDQRSSRNTMGGDSQGGTMLDIAAYPSSSPNTQQGENEYSWPPHVPSFTDIPKGCVCERNVECTSTAV